MIIREIHVISVKYLKISYWLANGPHVNKAGTTIEMPYIKLNDAKYGAAQTAEAASAAMAAPMAMTNMSVRGIRLTPREMTGPRRAKSVTTTQAYDVTVSFNMDIETVNTKKPEGKTLSFEVTYAAVVESSTEVRSRILGRDLYAAAIDTVFTLLPSASQTAWAAPMPSSVTAPWSAAPWASNWVQPSTSSWSNILTASYCPIPLRPHTAG